MKFTLEKEGVNVVKMDITIPAKDAQQAYEAAVKRFAQYVNIDGFRKGKAPKHMVERQIGTERIKAEAIENIIPSAVTEIVRKDKLDLITQPAITDYDFEIGKDLKITVRAEERPDVTLGKYKDLTVTVQDTPVTQASFDNALSGLLARYAEEKTVTEKRAAKNTDIAVIDFDGSVDGKKIPGGAGTSYSLDLGNSNFIPGFAEAIVGHKVGEEFDINVTFPENYGSTDLQGKKAVFKINLHELKVKTTPELTDEIAKKAGPFESADALKADIQNYLETQRDNANKQNSENELFKMIVANAKVDIPQSMIEREKASIIEEYKTRLSQQGVTWDVFLKSQDENQIMKTINDDARSRIKNSLVIEKIARAEELKLETQDFQQKLSEMSAAYGVAPDVLVREVGQSPAFMSNLSQQAMNDKVRDFVMTNNKVVFAAASGGAAKKSADKKPAAKEPAAKKPAAEKKPAAKKPAKKTTTKKAK